MKNRKKWLGLTVAAGALVLTLGVVSLNAWYKDEDSLVNHMTVGGVDLSVEEEFDPPEEVSPGDHITKKVKLKNQGPDAAYVRAKVIFSNGEAEAFCHLDYYLENWVLEEDGYYYYTKSLNPGEETEYLFEEVSISWDTPESYLNQLNIIVYGEACQSQGFTGCKAAWETMEQNREVHK